MAFRSKIEQTHPHLQNGHPNQTDYGTKIWVGSEEKLFTLLCNGNPGDETILTGDLVAGIDLLEQDLRTSNNPQEQEQTHRNFLSFLDTAKRYLKNRPYRAYENLSDPEKSVRDRIMQRMVKPTQQKSDTIELITPKYTNGIDLTTMTEIEKNYRNRLSPLEQPQ